MMSDNLRNIPRENERFEKKFCILKFSLILSVFL